MAAPRKKSYDNVAGDELDIGVPVTTNQPTNLIQDDSSANSDSQAESRGLFQILHGHAKQSYKDTKKSTVDLAKEIQVECFEELEIYESMKFLKENWAKWIFIPYLPAFHRPGWLLRYVVGPHNVELFMSFFSDFVAGVTVALTLIPQALSYAQLANLPPINGLYTAVLTSAAYAFFGSSMQLCVGPVALVSLLTGQLINEYNIDYVNDPQQAIDFAGEVAVAVGVILIIMSLLNMGNLIRFIAHPVMSGFTTAAAALIGMNQLKSAFGFTEKVPQQGQTDYEYNYQVMQWIMDHWYDRYHFTADQIKKKKSLALQNGLSIRNPLATKICFGLFIPLVLIVILKNNIKATPERKKTIWYNVFTVVTALMPFVAIIIGAHIAWQIKHDDGYNNPDIQHDFYSKNLSIVGNVKAGLDFVRVPTFRWSFGKLMGDVFQIALIAYMESYGVAQRIAHQNHEFHLLNASQELWSIGIANVLAAFSSSYPVAGSFSRSSLNAVAGAKTPLSKIVNMLVVVLALGTLTKTFQYIPSACLAAIIWVAVFNLISVSDFWNTWKHSKKDFFVMLVTLIFVFVFDTGIGLAIGIGTSVLVYLMDSTFNPENAPELVEDEAAEKRHEIAHVRLRGDFNFLTSGRVLDLLTSLTLVEPKKPDVIDSTWSDRVFFRVSSFFDALLKPQLIEGMNSKLPKAIILDLAATRVMDITALHDIEEQAKTARQMKILFVVINASPVLSRSLVKFGFKNDDLTGSVDFEVAQHYNLLAGNRIPRIKPKVPASVEEGSVMSSHDDGASEIQLIPVKVADDLDETRKDV